MQVPCVGWIIPDVDPFLRWLVEGAVGPTAAGLPVTWAASDLASAARRWFRRRRHSDGLSRIVKAASGTGVDLTADEFDAVRLLLEQESTWVLAGRGTVEDLASWIASCLTARPSSGRFAAGLAVAHGILEFAVRDLEPQWFQQVVFARLDRIRTEQAATLDHLMAAMHADMTALVALQKATTAGFLALMSALARVLDRMPGPADHGQVAVYLAVLARWLSTDPWLASSGAAHLAPASIERKLTVASADRKPVMADADDLAHRCIRLVILGEPGSGKTWLARRAARLSAEAALKDLADGKTLDEVELPLYVTCARLAAAPPGDVIRRAVVSSALGHLPDLGAARLTEAVRTLFEERQSATMLVADSLDEARGADDRVRLIDSLPDKWRIVLTSRPGAWQQQLHIGKDDSGRQVGTLQPLRYPEDVEPVIERWLAGNPASAADLSRQLRARPALQQTATVPLILAFYCIASGDRPLPTLRRDLYDQVLRRMLAGRWRGNREREIDPDACLSTLCAWAWSAAEADTISGIGTWSDDFLTDPVRNHGHDERAALDHVAVPLGRVDDVTRSTERRFVHRTVREHLVATYVASMSAEEAAAELIKHLWYDPDWQYAAPAALAAHQERNQVLLRMTSLMTSAYKPPVSLSAADRFWEVRRFLSAVAEESNEADWSGLAAQIVRQALLDLAAAGKDVRRIDETRWPTSVALMLDVLLTQLASDDGDLRWLVPNITALAVTPKSRARSRKAMIDKLTGGVNAWNAQALAEAIAELGPTPRDRNLCRHALVKVAARERHPLTASDVAGTMVKLAYTPREMSLARNLLLELLTGNSDPWKSPPLADLLTTMRPTREELAAARRVLLGILATGDKPIVEPARSVIRLRAPMHERARARQAVLAYAMTTQNYSSEFIEIIAQLTATTRERAEARRAVVRHIEANPGKHFMATQLLARLVVGPRERSETRRALLSALVLTPSWGDSRIASVAAGLAATAKERSETRAVLMLLIAADPKRAWTYTEAITSLIATKRDRTRTRMMLYPITVMDNESKLGLASLYASLSPARSERADLRRGLLAFLSDPPDPGIAWEVSKIVVQLSPNASERALVRLRLLDELEARDDGWWAGPRIAETLWRLEPGARDRKRLRGALIGALEDMVPIYAAGSEKQVAKLAEQVAKLSPTASDLAAMRKRLLDLAGAVPQYCISPAPETLIQVVTGFKPSAAERKRARSILITAFESSPWKIEDVDFAGILARLAPTQAERMATQNELARMLYKRSSQRSEYKVRLAVSFAETSLERRILAQALLENLVSGNTGWDALAYADALDYLSTSARDRARIRQELLIALTRQRRAEMIIIILHVIQRLDPTLRIKARARNKILDLLAEQHDQIFVDALTQDNAVQLAPTARDLFAIATLDAYFMTVLMRAARCNSSINEWLALITRLAKTSD